MSSISKRSAVLVGLLILVPAVVLADTEPRAAAALIDALSLRESPRPIREHPRWAPPEKIAIVVPVFVSRVSPDLEARIREVAGQAEVDLITSLQPAPANFAGADVVIGACNPLLSGNANLRWVHSYAVGVERCIPVLRALSEPPILTNGQRLTGPNIAEHAIGMLLALRTNLHRFYGEQLAVRWTPRLPDAGLRRELGGSTMLVAGLGGIGTEVARRADALGMRVIATRNSSRRGPDFVDYVGLSNELLPLAAEADVIVNALPLTPDTDKLFDAKFFAAAKPGALFINVGRGGSVDQSALIDALESGRLAGAGLDVTDPEPLPADSPLWSMTNVVITPHVSGQPSVEAIQRVSMFLVENLRRYVAGEPLLNVVDFERGY